MDQAAVFLKFPFWKHFWARNKGFSNKILRAVPYLSCTAPPDLRMEDTSNPSKYPVCPYLQRAANIHLPLYLYRPAQCYFTAVLPSQTSRQTRHVSPEPSQNIYVSDIYVWMSEHDHFNRHLKPVMLHSVNLSFWSLPTWIHYAEAAVKTPGDWWFLPPSCLRGCN